MGHCWWMSKLRIFGGGEIILTWTKITNLLPRDGSASIESVMDCRARLAIWCFLSSNKRCIKRDDAMPRVDSDKCGQTCCILTTA